MKKFIKVVLNLFDGAEGGGAEGSEGGETASGEESSTPSAAETESGEKEESAADSEEEREKTYREFIKANKDLYARDTQNLINRRFKETKNLESQLESYRPLMDILAQRYGATDVESAIRAMEEDNTYWEQAAFDANMSVEQYKKFARLERENRALHEQQRQAENEWAINRQMEEWRNQEQEMRELYPEFDLETEISNNPEFGSLLSHGVPVKHAFEVLHIDEIKQAMMSVTAQQTAKAVTDNIRAKGQRPAENGASSGNAFVEKIDVAKLTKKEREEFAKRAERGEIISF